MTANPETKTNSCEFCHREFVRESTYQKHVCEPKRRWLERDRIPNRIAYGSWKNYYQTYHPSKKNTEYADFIKNSYYTAFVKFGNYCTDIRAINPLAYSTYLVKNRVSIDNWCSDRSYSAYITEYLRNEDCMDAVKRTVESLLELSDLENIQLYDVFRYINSNKLCQLITQGRISPWVLYQSRTGPEFLGKLNQDQTNLIFEYINPEKWNIKFRRQAQDVEQVKTVVNGIRL